MPDTPKRSLRDTLTDVARASLVLGQQVASLRTLLIYRLFGFLHSTIGMRNPDAQHLAAHREWVREDLRETLARWQQAA